MVLSERNEGAEPAFDASTPSMLIHWLSSSREAMTNRFAPIFVSGREKGVEPIYRNSVRALVNWALCISERSNRLLRATHE